MRSWGFARVASVVLAVVGTAALVVTPRAGGAVMRFTVSYTGSGSWHTVYHSEPPNVGGPHDTNDAHDSSTQRWSLRFTQPLVVPSCVGAAGCPGLGPLTSAIGATSATGTINHAHVDGLYSFDNALESCHVSAATPARQPLSVTLQARYLPARRAVLLTALTPLAEALLLLPVSCPGQGDPIDGLNDNYFMPGFSFASGWGPDRWFTSAAVVPLRVLQSTTRITVPLADTAAGTPPADCGPSPSYVLCHTWGSWQAALTLTHTP